MLNVVMRNVVMLNDIMMNVIMLNVVMLNVVMMNFVVPNTFGSIGHIRKLLRKWSVVNTVHESWPNHGVKASLTFKNVVASFYVLKFLVFFLNFQKQFDSIAKPRNQYYKTFFIRKLERFTLASFFRPAIYLRLW
jgi:hypothetical protein